MSTPTLPVVVPLASEQTPVGYARALAAAGIPAAIWEQNPRSEHRRLLPHVGRFRYLLIDPLEHSEAARASDPFQYLKDGIQNQNPDFSSVVLDQLFPTGRPAFIGGFLILLGYEAVGSLERIVGLPQHSSLPRLTVSTIDTFVVWDTLTLACYLVCWPLGRVDFQVEVKKILTSSNLRQRENVLPPVLATKDVSILENVLLGKSEQEFIEMVERAKEYICAGDIFQVVLSNTFVRRLAVDPLTYYRRLTEQNPSPYQFFIPGVEYSLVGSSPEMMLNVDALPTPGASRRSRALSMRLVAGTYPRSIDTTVPNMLADPKEHAEHVMLVDHVRNDIGRVAGIGSVEVRDLCAIETYRDVHHLVSQVAGELPPEATSIDALRATFPIATLTGTPKIRAMEIIAELEGEARGFFGGAVTLLGFDDFLESAVIIRTALIRAEEVEIRAGAGIVYDSNPEREFRECVWKAEALLDLLRDFGSIR